MTIARAAFTCIVATFTSTSLVLAAPASHAKHNLRDQSFLAASGRDPALKNITTAPAMMVSGSMTSPAAISGAVVDDRKGKYDKKEGKFDSRDLTKERNQGHDKKGHIYDLGSDLGQNTSRASGLALACGITEQVNSKTEKDERCPKDCPYFAQNRHDDLHCTFTCVRGDECKNWNPNKPIPDTIRKSPTCRGPKVDFCREPNLDGTDTCRVCQRGFKLNEKDGWCYFQHWTTIIIGVVVVVIIFTIVIVWFVDLCCRPTINGEEVKRAQEFRSRAKIHIPKEDVAPGERRKTWPIDTNLCTVDVAGPGMMLHFNFQAFLIVWPLCVALLWTMFGFCYAELFVLGTKKFGTPRHNCILVAWGYEKQQSLMWTKALFILIVYVFTFLSCLLFGVWQHRLIQQADAQQKTMKDFAVELKGLPQISGEDRYLETDLAAAVQAATQKTVIGVSVAWNFQNSQEAVIKAVKDDQDERERVVMRRPLSDDDEDPLSTLSPLRSAMYKVERYFLVGNQEEENQDIVTLLEGMVTTESAFVVFNTEDDRNDAVKILREQGFTFTSRCEQECALSVHACKTEPAAVNWHNFGDSSLCAMLRRLLWGFTAVYIPALLIWLFVFYVPYAWSVYNFNYENGAEPPIYFSIAFTVVVVGGNAIMYFVCDVCSDVIGCRFKDSKQTCYMLLYLFACMFNVALDMVITYWMAMNIAVGQDFRTYDGTRIADVQSFTDQFETYAMQRILAENAYSYAFPSTFLVPFLIEPIVTVLVPYQLGKLIIRTHKEIKGQDAEAYLAAFDFDLGRYADILLNVFLGILIFYFPGGYTWTLFYGMFISHIVIYIFDHWRVLNVIPAVKLVSSQVDWWAQVMLAGCTAMILSSLIFKANCESYSGYCYKDMDLIMRCTLAAVIHFILHVALLLFVVPLLGKKFKDEHEGMNFEHVARNEAGSWFSTNPVHCLRSKFLHRHKPHCRFVSAGKEHLLEVNEKIGCYFDDVPADTEDFSGNTLTMGEALSSARTVTRSLTGLVHKS